MRKLGLILLWLSIALPLEAATRVSLDGLNKLIAQEASKPDADLAWRIGDLQLTERMNASTLASLEKSMPGEKSKQALIALSDASQFLEAPAGDIAASPAPSVDDQKRMLAQVVGYVAKTIPQLPNFVATRETTRFEDTPQYYSSTRALIPYQPMHYVGASQTEAVYRDGHEVADTGTKKGKDAQLGGGLTTWGVFGPILGTVLVDAARSKLAWSHWERGETGNVAVFAFDVPRQNSHYEVNYCCVATESATVVAETHPFQQIVGYSGEMAIDPTTGAIVRLKTEADLKATDPVVRAAILVEYGAVEIGGRSYICPVRSISITTAQTVQLNPAYRFVVADRQQPLRTLLNDVAFVNYHVFGSESKILTAKEAAIVQGEGPSPAPDHGEVKGAKAGESAVESETGKSEGLAMTAPAPTATAAATPEVPPSAASTEPAEVSVAPAGALPDAPLTAQPAGVAGEFTVRTTTRLVDVAVVAYDAKGRPVTGLKAEDFQIFDNGRPEKVRFFGRAGGAGESATAAPATPAQPVYSNQASTQTATRSAESDTAILLIDSSNLAFGDLSYAREEMLRFLKTAPADERVGLYVLRRYGFVVLLEPTVDHAQVGATLAKWMPDAQDLANAQAEEERNREHFDWVHSSSDMGNVNGNSNDDMDLSGPSDPKLRSMGSDPAREVLALFRGIARHLAGIPGHKSLVWIASDNVLADWHDQAVSVERQISLDSTLAPGTDEALNEAHVSIYPLDASQLEGGGITADLRNQNIVPWGMTSRSPGLASLGNADPGTTPGRSKAQMKQDTRAIQGTFRDLAAATGGKAFRRAGDIAAELNRVVDDGRAAYSLSFAPDMPADNSYHHLTVKVAGRGDLKLRYRTGYFYGKEPVTLKERFREAVWAPVDAREIGVTATPERAANGAELKLNIAATDLGMTQQDGRWTDRLDIFLVERDSSAMHAKVSGKTLELRLKPATYQQLLHDGVAFEEHVAPKEGSGDVRAVVVDENTGRIGSVTLPAKTLAQPR